MKGSQNLLDKWLCQTNYSQIKPAQSQVGNERQVGYGIQRDLADFLHVGHVIPRKADLRTDSRQPQGERSHAPTDGVASHRELHHALGGGSGLATN